MENKQILQQIQSVYDDLCCIYESCERTKRYLEAVSGDSRLLLQPWPRKKKCAGPSLPDVTLPGAPDVTPSVAPQSRPPPADLAQLSVVERALAKAERTRSRYLGRLETDLQAEAVTDRSDPSSTNPGGQVPQRSDKASTAAADSVIRDESKPSSKPRADKQAPRSGVTDKVRRGQAGVISQGSLDRLLHAPVRQSTSGQQVSNRAQSSSSRAQSSSSRAQPSSNRARPGHVSAPYRTDAPRTKVKVTQPRPGRVAPGGSARRVERGGRGGAPTAGTSTGALRASHQSAAAARGASQAPSLGPDALGETAHNQTAVQHGMDATEHVTDATEHVTDAVQQLQLQLQASATECTTAKQGCDGQSTSQSADNSNDRGGEKFLLRTQGKQLSLPARLTKLRAQNRRLRAKVRGVMVTRAVDAGQPPCEVFMARLAEQTPLDARLTRLLALACLHHELRALLDQVPASGCNDPGCRAALAHKQKLAVVLSAFSEATQMLQDVSGVPEHSSEASPRQPQLSSPQEAPGGTDWLPRRLQAQPLGREGRGTPPLRRLRYASPRQLTEYTRLAHRVQELRVQRYTLSRLQGLVGALGDDGHSRDTGHTQDTHAVYRALYALLCTAGHGFPTLVQDNIADLHDNEQEDF